MTRYFRQPAIWLFGLAALLLLAHALWYGSLTDFDAVDDAYISFRYAWNAARGYGLTFNVGERRVEGYTNFLWTVMLIPFFWLKLPIHLVALGLGTAWSLGCVVLLGLFAGRHLQDLRVGALAALLLAADGSFALWSVGGLEGPLFAFLILAGAISYLCEMTNPRRVPLSGVWFALAAMTRPEGLLVYALTGVHQVLSRVLGERRLADRQDWQRLGLFCLVWVPWFAFRWRYYGFPLPNTFYAKVTLDETTAQRMRGWAYVQTFVRIHLGWTLPVIALLPLLRRDHRRWSSYFVLLIVVYSLYIAYVGGDWSVGRFFVPLMPFFYTLLADGVIAIGEWVLRALSARRPVSVGLQKITSTIVVLALIGGLFWQSSLKGEKALFLDPFDARLAGRARTTLGKWMREHLPPDTYIAVDAAGQIPFYSDLRALDLYGLNDLVIAHSQVARMGEGTPGHEKMNMDYVIFVAQPDYIIIYGTAFDWLEAFSYRRVDLPWTDDPALKAFLGIYRRQ